MTFTNETLFEDAVVDALQRNGWGEVIEYPTEQELIDNWAEILFQNNRSLDRLDDVRLTRSEMDQVMEQVTALKTPLKLNEFINGRTVAIKRDAPGSANLGHEVSLKIYDRMEIAGGQSRYQIVRQPKFKASKEVLPPRRGDLMLLINGMPVIHLELKRSGVPVSQACNQVDKYAHEHVFSNLFSLVQVFVAMTPDKTLYFANPGPGNRFNQSFAFHWADFDNNPINEWNRVVERLLSIPMAHQLIGFYTVADRAAGVFMVMRSYQYYAASQIASAVAKKAWGDHDQRGGYVWHTTGSGKTVTSFKTAQLIADSKDADKVVFLLDRIELGSQSFENYRSFGGDAIDVEDTANSHQLLAKLKDDHSVLLVTSIQKMSMLKDEAGVRAADMADLRRKRIVFVVDEAHRSTFGEMLSSIKETLPDALFFGFTGTPIHEENQRKHTTTTGLFGNELHRYSIADGIRDKNVLGFDPEMVQTYRESDLRKQVALLQAKASDEVEALTDPVKAKVFNKFMNRHLVPMAFSLGADSRPVKGIEDYVPSAQYRRDEHRRAVVDDIMENWTSLSQNGKFHAILATSSILEAIEYYRLFRDKHPNMAVTALFDPTIDNTGEAQLDKEDGLVEILEDYNASFGQSFTMSTHALFKADVSNRLAHKEPYNTPGFTKDKQLNLLIVVDQMLTGFDSKWLNTLYLDKVIEYESIIQAFSRTNRLFGPDKPFGSIRYYRKPWTMKQHIAKAVELYSGNKPLGLFVDHLDDHLKALNERFGKIQKLFADIDDFSQLPASHAGCGEFAKIFSEFYHHLQAARIQGFSWSLKEYTFNDPRRTITVDFDEHDYQALVVRYQELAERDGDDTDGETGADTDAVPFDIDSHISHINTGAIDAEYMNDKFQKYIRARRDDLSEEELQALLEELHASFARLTSDDQVFANLWLRDIEAGTAELLDGKTVAGYINDYKQSHQDRQIAQLVKAVGLDEQKLRNLLAVAAAGANIDEYSRFAELMTSVDSARAKAYLERREGRTLPPFRVSGMVDKLLRTFILRDELPKDLEVPKAAPPSEGRVA